MGIMRLSVGVGMTLRVLDLYSGLGGASEAFVEGGHHVVRVENNPALKHIPHTKIADASWAYNLLSEEKFDLVWSSPPCVEFSRTSMPWTRKKLPEDFEPSMEDVEKSRHIIKWLRPRYWVIENVRGAIPYFEPLLGEARQKIGPFVLWHNLPQIILPRNFGHTKAGADVWSSDPLRANKKAKVPIEISRAVLEAVMLPTLGDF